MGFSIGGLLNDVGIKLPKIDLGSIGKTVLDEGKKILGEVVKDSFTLSNQPGQVFDSNMNLNILGDNIRLPNPIGALANKLLGKADGELNKFGVNVDFKSLLGKLFHLPTESGPVAVPPVSERGGSIATPAATPAASGAGSSGAAAGVGGGGGAVSVSADTAVPAAPTGLNSGVDGMFNNLGNQESSLMGQLNQALTQTPDENGMITINGKKVNASAYMQKLQFQMNIVQEMMQTLSNILKTEHDGRMNTIANIRG